MAKKIKPDGSKTLYVAGIYEVNKNSGGTVTGTVTYYPAAGAMRINSTLYYVLKDHLGSASVVTDSSGATVGEDRFYPFGETRFTTGTMQTDKLFTGQREITGLGIYHYGARFYSPKLGRFLSADTIVPGYANPQNLNRFSYTRNNPIRYVDPSGHMLAEGTGGGCFFCTQPPTNNYDGGGGGKGLSNPIPETDPLFYADYMNTYPYQNYMDGNGANCWSTGPNGYACGIPVNIVNDYKAYNRAWQVGVEVGLTIGLAAVGLLCGGAAAACALAGAIVGGVAGAFTANDLSDVQDKFDNAVIQGNITIGQYPDPESNKMYVGTGPNDFKVVSNPITQLYLKSIIWLNNVTPP